METDREVNISVRDLVEFILRSGDIDTRSTRVDTTAMQDGSRLHRKLQKEMGAGYRAEVSLKHEAPVDYDGEPFCICVEGRADGIFTDGITFIDEIKTTFIIPEAMEKPVGVHRAQAMCYAYIYAEQQGLDRIGIRMTYCSRENEDVKYFTEQFEFAYLKEWFYGLIQEYAKWAAWQRRWKRLRDETIKQVGFPFEYREGQQKLVGDVYRTILRKKKLFIEAPTGVGKTISTVFPAVRAMGEQLTEKIFYGTAKTIARTVAEEAFGILSRQGMKLKVITLTAKERICVLEKPECNPVACERARGHFDRVNDAVFDMLTHEESINRQLVEEYAQKHMVCPFEMSLDVATWADAVICDYNYIFDPTAHLRRFFETGTGGGYIFLLDEAHNLVERAREMFSAELIKEQFLEAKAAIRAAAGAKSGQKLKGHREKLAQALDACNAAMLRIKRECDEFEVWEDLGGITQKLMRFAGLYEEFSKDLTPDENEVLRDLYFEVRHFIAMDESRDDDYTIYSDYTPDRKFRLRLQCMEPARSLKEYLAYARSSVFFSATLLPVKYYIEELGGDESDYAVYAPSPFDTKKRLLLVANDVSMKYTRRTDGEYARIAEYIEGFVSAKTGNYIIFFPSYKVMESVAALTQDRIPGIRIQGRNMTEEQKEEFLSSFEELPETSNIGFCVMGGIFAEGIDLKNDRLIGVAVVGTGLPMVCNERELFRGYFDIKNGRGFDYAYLYSGMNKVLQAAGRVIRTTEDTGAILLLDERFLNREYLELFPREWNDYREVNIHKMKDELAKYWSTVS